jgi:hypothetical protein
MTEIGAKFEGGAPMYTIQPEPSFAYKVEAYVEFDPSQAAREDASLTGSGKKWCLVPFGSVNTTFDTRWYIKVPEQDTEDPL